MMPTPNPYQWRSGEWTDRAGVQAEARVNGGAVVTVTINGSGMRHDLTPEQTRELSEVLAAWADGRKADIQGSGR
jgi:hypothetical protein